MTDPRTAGYVEAYLKPLGITSMLDAVVQLSGRHLGLLCLEHVGKPHRWERDEIVFACQLADKIALALANRERRLAEEKLRDIIEHATNLFFSHGSDDRLTYVSPQTLQFLDCTPDEALVAWTDFLTDNPANREGIRLTRRAVETGEPQPAYELELVGKRGRKIWVQVNEGPVVREGTTVAVVGALTDITERKRAEAALVRANRALRTLSAGNTALVHAADEQALLAEMCRVIVEVGRYGVAVALYARNDEAKSVEPMACHGIDPSEVRGLRLSWADDERGHGPIGTAIRSGATQLVRDAQEDPRQAPWQEALIRTGARSELALPLRFDSHERLGALYIASADPEAFDAEETRLLTELAGDLAFGVATLRTGAAKQQAEAKLRQSLERTVEAVAAMLEARDPYTAGHERRVAQLATAIAREIGLPEETAEGIRFGALIHDLGKIQVPAEILAKPTRLSKTEFELIKVHPQAGYEILKGIEFPWPVASMVHQHHERLDGSGYPQGLKGDEISPEACILAVADTVEAMFSHRPYRPGLGVEAALAEIEKGRGTRYDAQAVDACLHLFRLKGFAWR